MSLFGKILMLCAITVTTPAATTCKNLCERFGDPIGCQRHLAGELDCTHPAPPKAQSTVVSHTHTHKTMPAPTLRRYTRWKDTHGITMRFALTITPDRLDVVGESSIPLDPYEFHFNSTRLWGYHLLEADMRCHPTKSNRYECRNSGGDYAETTIEYRTQPNGIFSLKIYAAPSSTSPQASPAIEAEYSSNGREFIIKRFGTNGTTEIYPLSMP